MKISTITKIGAVGIATACICAADAQTNGPSGLSVRLGLFAPTSSDASDISRHWVDFGLDYKLNILAFKVPGVDLKSYFSISADYYSHSGDNDLPVALNYNLRQGSIIYSAGIGPEFRNAGDLTGTGTGIGEQLGISYEFGSGPLPIFLQAKYFISSRPELSGLAGFVGVRF